MAAYFVILQSRKPNYIVLLIFSELGQLSSTNTVIFLLKEKCVLSCLVDLLTNLFVYLVAFGNIMWKLEKGASL